MSPEAELPTDLTLLLDDAASEAKRRGHESVTLYHLAEALDRHHNSLIKDVLANGGRERIDAQLAKLPTGYNPPVADESTIDLLKRCATSRPSLPAVGEEVSAFIDGLPSIDPIQTGEVPGESTAKSETEGAGVPASSVAKNLTTKSEDQKPVLTEYQSRLVEIVSNETPLLPREDVVTRIAALLAAKHPQTPLVMASEGEGRTELARCLAAFLNRDGFAGPLAGMPVYRVKGSAVLAEGQAALTAALDTTAGKAICYVDDLEVLIGLGNSSAPSGSLLTPIRQALDDPRMLIVLAIATEYVDRFQAADIELFDEMVRVNVPPLDREECDQIAAAIAPTLGEHHGVTIPADVISAATAPPRQIDTLAHPALAIARLDRAAATAAIRREPEAHIADLGSNVSPQQYLNFDAKQAQKSLRKAIWGQDDAIETVTNRLALTRKGLDLRPERPDGVFLFAGPTGTGKTALALALAKEIFGSEQAIIRLDMSEYDQEHTVSKLIGSPPGYVGSTEPESWLTTKIRTSPQCVLLLDEIEKSHERIWNTFLQVFDAGRLTDSHGRVADFRDVVIVMTTNIGAESFSDKSRSGFLDAGDVSHRGAVVKQIEASMRPELLNRLDSILVFEPLTEATVREIAEVHLKHALKRLARNGWDVTYDDSVIELLLKRGFSREYGARPMLRAIESAVIHPISQLEPGTYSASAESDRVVLVPKEVQ